MQAVITRRAATPRRRAYLFDLDGTLYQPRPVTLVMALSVLWAGPSVTHVVRCFRNAHEVLRAQPDAVATPFEAQLARTADTCGISTEQVRRIVDAWFIERPLPWIAMFRRRKLLAAIQSLKSRGDLVAVVSDYPARRKLQALGVMSAVDVIVASGEDPSPQHLKPSPDEYLLAAQLLGVRSDECVVIGDRRDLDGEAAKRAGMAFQIARNDLRFE